MSKAKDLGGAITEGIGEYGDILGSIIDKLGPALSKIKDQFGALVDQLKADDLLTPEEESALLARLDALDDAIEDA